MDLNRVIDLRSDTVTRPTAAMRRAMAEAEVGDDVIDVDPTVERLEQETAAVLDMPAALFMPSGSMANQIAVRVHCQRGSEFLCEAGCHIYNYEQAAFAQLSGLVAQTVAGTDGVLQVEQLTGLVRPHNDHMVRTQLIALENTHNRAGGTIQPLETVEDICRWADEQGLRRHLDGARLWNAVAATGIEADRWAGHFDSVSVCFSKGLGAPVGSVLAGTKDFIAEARRARKLFGGGMRQAGIIAAGALYALRHHRGRLDEDHHHAQILKKAIDDSPSLVIGPAGVQTNIVRFEVDPDWGTAAELVRGLEEQGVRCLAFGPQAIRLVTHLDVSSAQIDRAAEAIRAVAGKRAGSVVEQVATAPCAAEPRTSGPPSSSGASSR